MSMEAQTRTEVSPGLGADPSGFYSGLPIFDSFENLTDPTIYTPLPAGWLIGTSDIVRSTAAIEAGRYKVVNTAAAAVIVAVANALKNNDFPFVFGGDGAAFALPPHFGLWPPRRLPDVAGWVRDEFALELRVAMVSVDELRGRGVDVQVARFAPSPNVSYAMFTGGGLAYAEQRMKAGEFALRAGPARIAARSQRAVVPFRGNPGRERADPVADRHSRIAWCGLAPFNRLIGRVLRLAESRTGARRPIPEGGPAIGSPFLGFDIEKRTLPQTGSIGNPDARSPAVGRPSRSSGLTARSAVSIPPIYRRQLVENSDFRNSTTGLRMTLDCTPALADELESGC